MACGRKIEMTRQLIQKTGPSPNNATHTSKFQAFNPRLSSKFLKHSPNKMTEFTDNLLNAIAIVGLRGIRMHPATLKLNFEELRVKSILEEYYDIEEDREEEDEEYTPEYKEDELERFVSELTWDTPIWADINKLVVRNDTPGAEWMESDHPWKGEPLVYTLKPTDRDITIKDFVECVWRVKVNKTADEVPPTIKKESITEEVVDDEFVMCATYAVNF
jgi:hypothetical protein